MTIGKPTLEASAAGDRLVHAALLHLAADARDTAPLPDPAPIYWRARVLGRLTERQQAAAQASRPVEVTQAAAVLVVALLGAVALSWAFPELAAWVLRTTTAGLGSSGLDGSGLGSFGLDTSGLGTTVAHAAGGALRLVAWTLAALLLGGALMGLQVLSERG